MQSNINLFITKKAQNTSLILTHLTMKRRMEKKNWEPGGQRLVTVLAYLNDVQEGGGTEFPEMGVTINAKKGNVAVFHNTLPLTPTTNHSKVHPRSLHGGMPVIKGEKWMVNLWFRENLRY